jgi:hypothetical protein
VKEGWPQLLGIAFYKLVGDRHYCGTIESLNAKIVYLCLEEPVPKGYGF